MAKLTKYTYILICWGRSNGSTINELCSSFGLERKTIVRILRCELILPVDSTQLPTDSDQKRILSMKKALRSNPYLSLEELNMRSPMIFNECCLERYPKIIQDFLRSLANDN